MAQIGARSAGKPCSRKRMIGSHFFAYRKKVVRKFRRESFASQNLRGDFLLLPPLRGTSLLYRAPKKDLPWQRFLGKGDAGVKGAAVAVRQSLAYMRLAATRRQGSVDLRRRGGKGKAETRTRTPSVTVSGLTTPPSCLRQGTCARGRDRARAGNGAHKAPCPSSQVAKSPPGSSQEST